jgi:hypothetical protein
LQPNEAAILAEDLLRHLRDVFCRLGVLEIVG